MKKTIILIALAINGISIAQSWNLNGNSGTAAGTNYVGTSDGQDLVLKTNNLERMRLNATGNVAVGGVPNDPGVTFQVHGRTQFMGNVNSDAVQIRNNTPTVGTGFDLLWLTYDKYQTNDVGLITASAPPVLNDWAAPMFTVRASGKAAFGTTNYNCADCAGYRLFVKDGIRTEKVKVDVAAANGWADYVFEKEYKLMPLAELENFIKENKHLPEVPTTNEAIEKGVELKEMNILLLKKVEELTLHVIDLNKKIEEIQNSKK